MLCFQSLLSLGTLDICSQRHIIGNVFYSTFTNVLILVTFVTFLKFFFERFYIYAQV